MNNQSKAPRITLEQWLAFHTIVEEGSFAKAAETLNKSQSTLSYIITKMQDQLPAPVFEQRGRKAELTDLGRVLYRQAKDLIEQARQLDKTAEYFASGWEEEVIIAIDAIIPTRQIFCALQAFAEQSEATRIRIIETALSGTDEAILTRKADLVITVRVPPGFFGEHLGEIRMFPVAHSDFPIFQHGDQITESELKQYRQIVIRDPGLKRNQDAGWLGSEKRWTMTHFDSSVEAVRNGLGFAFIPEPMVKADLDAGHLKKIPLESGSVRHIPIHLVITDQSHAGPATKSLANIITQTSKFE